MVTSTRTSRLSSKLQCLPASRRWSQEEIRKRVSEIKKNLAWSASIGHYSLDGGSADLTEFLMLRLPLEVEDAKFFVNLLWDMILKVEMDLTQSMSCVMNLTDLLRNYRDSLDITLPWRPLYTMIEEKKLVNNSPNFSPAALSAYASLFCSLVRRSKKFFPVEAANEIYNEFVPLMAPHDNRIFKRVMMLVNFMPTSKKSGFKIEWIPQFLAMWEWTENDNKWDKLWFYLFSRIAKHQVGNFQLNWDQFLPTLFSHYLRVLDVTLGSVRLSKPHRAKRLPTEWKPFMPSRSISRCFGRVVIFSISPHSSAQTRMTQLINTVESYYHPSNSGHWTQPLGVLMHTLCEDYAKRIASERSKESSHIPADFRLSVDKNDLPFISTMIPIGLQALYSKDEHTAVHGRRSIHLLFQINAQYVAQPVLERIFMGFETTTAAHQIMGSFSLLGETIASLILTPQGKESLLSILSVSLEGINPNDIKKTMEALKIYYRLFSCTELDDNFADWSLDLMDRLFSFLADKEEVKKNKDLIWRYLFKETLVMIFSQASPQVFDSLSKKLCKHITSVVDLNAKKEYYHMCQAATFANPSQSLKLFIPSLHRLLVFSKAGTTSLADLAEKELQWHLSNLSGIVKFAGKDLLQHKNQLGEILSLTLQHEEVSIAKAASRVLRQILGSLTFFYPVDIRTRPETCNYTAENVAMQWHEPTTEENAWAMELMQKEFEDITQLFAKQSKNEVRNALERLLHLLANARELITAVPDEENRKEKKNQKLLERGLPPRYLEHPKYLTEGLLPVEFSLRIGNFLHECVQVLSTDLQSSINSLKTLTKIISSFIGVKGIIKSQKLNTKKFAHAAFANKYRDYTVTHKGRTRNHTVEKIYIRYLKSLQDQSEISSSALHRTLIEDLFKLSVSPFSEVRRHAQSAFSIALYRIPLISKHYFPAIIELVAQPGSEEDHPRITGGIHLLMDPKIMLIIMNTRTWQLAFLESYCKTYVHENQERTVQAKLFSLFPVAAVQLSSSPLSTKPLPLDAQMIPQLPEGTIQKGIERVAHKTAKYEALLKQKISSLSDIIETQNLSWKYKLITKTFLAVLLKGNTSLEERPLKLILSDLSSDTVSMRILSNTFLGTLLSAGNSKPATRFSCSKRITLQEVMDLSPVTDQQSWSTTMFIDENAWGFNGPVEISSDPVPAPPALSQFTKEYLTPSVLLTILGFQAHDHTKQQGEAGPSSSGISASSIMRFVSGQGHQAGMEDDTAVAVLKNVMQPRKAWPYTKSSSLGYFSVKNSKLWKGIFRLCGPSALEAIKEKLTSMINSENEVAEVYVSAEVIGAAIRATKSMQFSHVQQMWTLLEPMIILLIDKSGVKSLAEVYSAIQFATSQMDPRRVTPLLSILMNNPLEGTTSNVQSKRLMFLRSALTELAWRGAGANVSVLHLLEQNISHPFKQVREVIGEFLSIVFANLWEPPRSPDDKPSNQVDPLPSNPRMEDFISRMVTKFNSWETTDMLSQEEISERSNFSETILRWVSFSFSHGYTRPVVAYLPQIIRLVFLMQRDPNDSVSNSAKATLPLIAQTHVPLPVMSAVLDIIFQLGSTSEHWRIRGATLPVLQILVFNHKFELKKEQASSVINYIINLLTDPQVEVRELARGAFQSVAKTTEIDHNTYIKKFKKMAGTPIQKGDKTDTLQRHGGVLGLCALAATAPYDVPDWMPELLVSISKHADDPHPIKDSVRACIAEFWRTHQDMWSIFSSRFTEDQMTTIKELSLSPSYYA